MINLLILFVINFEGRMLHRYMLAKASLFVITFVILVLLAFSTIGIVYANEVYEEQWSQTFGGIEEDGFRSVGVCSDGGYILAGYTESQGAGMRDGWVVKLDSEGNEQWSKTFGGTEHDELWSVGVCSDGGFILAGSTKSQGLGGSDGWVVKLDASGTEQWSKTFGTPSWDGFYSIDICLDGGYILAGYTRFSGGAGGNDGWVVKLDSAGNEQWNKTFGGSDFDDFYSVGVDLDGSYIFAGRTKSQSEGVEDGWVVKLDSEGNEQLNKTFGGTEPDEFKSVGVCSDGGYILVGYTESQVTYSAGWVVKLDASGAYQWSKTFGGESGGGFRSVCVLQDGYLLAGDIVNAKRDGWIVKIDEGGTEQWSQTFGGTENYHIWSVSEFSDAYILAGQNGRMVAEPGSGDGWAVKLESTTLTETTTITTISITTTPSRMPAPQLLTTIICLMILTYATTRLKRV